MSDNDKAIRAAKLTLGAVLDKRRAKTAKDRSGGQIAPSKYLPDVPRQVHANGGPVMPMPIGYVPIVGAQVPRLATAAPLPPNSYMTTPVGTLGSMAGSVNEIAGMFLPEAEKPPEEPQGSGVQERPTQPAQQYTYAEGVTPEAIAAMDALRATYEQPLEITSSYRDREHNREVGGADQSQHVHGNAFDINTAHLTPEERVELANQAWASGFRGFGFYDNNMHFDVGDPRAWGPSYGYESLPEWSYGFVQQYLPETYSRLGYADGGGVDNLSRFLAGSEVRDYSSRTSSKDARHNDEFPPLKVYHGTRATFDAFRPSGEGTTTFMGIPVEHKRTGIFFSESPEFSEGFANPPGQKKTGTVGAYHLNIQNPLHADEDGFVDPKDRERLKAVGIDPQFVDYHLGDPRTMWKHFDGEDGEWFVNKLKEAGYDGARFHEEDPDTGKLAATWVAFHPTQVKSATGNVGTYDPNDERFNYADGGEVADLGAAREQKQLEGYHSGLMDDIGTRMSSAMDAHQKAVDQGVFEGYDVGDTLQGKAGPMRITGRFMAKWKPTRTVTSHFDRMGATPTVIEHEGQQYIPMLRYQTGREGDPDWQEGHAYLDMIRKADYPKMGGLRAVKADGGSVGDYVPRKTQKAYKLFRTKGDGNLYPLFVNAEKPVPTGRWLEAEEGPQGKTQGKVKSKLGDLAYRPGWHAGDLPVATHIGGKSDPSLKKPDYRPENHVWAEVEMAADKDWQSVADSRGKGVKAHITDQVPLGGFYRYKTNPNMTGNWLIGGHMKVNRVLSDDEVKQINDAAGTADLPRLPREARADGGSVAERSPMFEGMSEHLLDDTGKPMELWHGTPGEGFDAFDDKKAGSERDAGFYGSGHYLTPDVGAAEEYSTNEDGEPGTVMGPLHAALKNPYVWDASTEESRDALSKDLNSMGLKRGKMDPWDIIQRHELDRFMGYMRKRGHDGVIVRSPNRQDGEGSQVKEIVVFKPNLIKHRDAEIGDPNDPRIMRRDGGPAKGAR